MYTLSFFYNGASVVTSVNTVRSINGKATPPYINNVVKTAHIAHETLTIDIVNNGENCIQSIHVSDRNGFPTVDLIRDRMVIGDCEEYT